MPVVSNFKKCTHTDDPIDWRSCYACIDEVTTQLMIARTYLNELAHAEFNENGDCAKPITEPIQGRGFQQIAATAYSVVSG